MTKTFWLSHIPLNPTRSNLDPHRVHQILCRSFAGPDHNDPEHRARHGLLWRYLPARETAIDVLVQSTSQPDWTRLQPADLRAQPADRAPKENPAVLPGAAEGKQLRFTLLASPQLAVAQPRNPDGPRPRGRERPILDETGRRTWLTRIAQRSGFAVTGDNLIVENGPPLRSASKTKLAYQVASYRGLLTVTDAHQFAAARLAGFGPGKAYGLGLMLLAP